MKPAASRLQSCNVLSLSPSGIRIAWRFQVKAGEPVAQGPVPMEPGKPLPTVLVGNDWRRLLQPRIDVAWLPAESVFVRAVDLPSASPDEIPGMIEFQLERLSPLPPAQVVWTVETVEANFAAPVETPGTGGEGASLPAPVMTAWVTLVSRTVVEEWLERLKAGGYVADRLEFPLLRELRDCRPKADGVWLIVDAAPDARVVLAGWFLGGRWREIGLVRIPPGSEGATGLVDQLTRVAWAGEWNGWLKALPQVSVVAEEPVVAELNSALSEWSGQPVLSQSRLEPARVAELSARHQLLDAPRSLVPEDIALSRRHEFIDGLWIRALSVAAVMYLAFVFCFMVALKVQEYRLDTLRDEGNAIAGSYTNALQTKAQVAILQDQVALRFAALDAWRAAVEALPETLNLTQLDFTRGRALELTGTVNADNTAEVTKYNSELKKLELNGQPLFARVEPATFFPAQGPGGSVRWGFKAELKRAESP